MKEDSKNNTNIFLNYFDPQIKYMKMLTLWIPELKASKNEKIFRYSLFCMSTIFFVWYLSSEFLFLLTAESIDDLVGISRDILSHFVLIYKIINYIYFKNDMYEVINELTNSEFSYENFKEFIPQNIVKYHQKQVAFWRKLLMYSVFSLSGSLFTSQLILMYFFGDNFYIDVHGKKYYNQKLPIAMWSPFGLGKKWMFFYTLCMCSVGITLSGNLIAATDMLFASLVSCISAHINVLRGAFLTIRERCIARLNMVEINNLENDLNDPEILQKRMEDEMKFCIRHLQFIYRISERVERYFNIQALLQMLLSLFVICFCAYNAQALQGQDTGSILVQIIYLVALSFELLSYCWFGEEIIQESTGLSDAIYGSQWLSSSRKFKTLIIFTLTRLNKPLFFTLGKFSVLRFNMFLTVMRGAYSFNAVLRQAKN